MRDEHQRSAALRDAGEQQLDDLVAGCLVEIAGRLIGQENCRLGRERARERDALLLAAGKLGRIMLPPLAQAHGVKLARGALVRICDAGEFQRHGNVLDRRHGGNEMKRLKHDAHVAAAEQRAARPR